MNQYRKQKIGRAMSMRNYLSTNADLQEILHREDERREVERKMQEEDNKRLMYVDPMDKRFTL